MDKQAATDALIKVMNDAGTPLAVRVGASRGLGRIYAPDVRAELTKVMRDNGAPVDLRAAAAEALGGAAAL